MRILTYIGLILSVVSTAQGAKLGSRQDNMMAIIGGGNEKEQKAPEQQEEQPPMMNQSPKNEGSMEGRIEERKREGMEMRGGSGKSRRGGKPERSEMKGGYEEEGPPPEVDVNRVRNLPPEERERTIREMRRSYEAKRRQKEEGRQRETLNLRGKGNQDSYGNYQNQMQMDGNPQQEYNQKNEPRNYDSNSGNSASTQNAQQRHQAITEGIMNRIPTQEQLMQGGNQ